MEILTPALFIGHGSPMNLIQQNKFTEDLTLFGKRLEKPKAIVVISAHWLTKGTYITFEEQPRMIYDFYGFPRELYNVKYPAKGSPKIAEEIMEKCEDCNILGTDTWGYDHASYMVLAHLFPKADVPTLELSINFNKEPMYHYKLGKSLTKFREQGIMFIGSGNLIHTFRELNPVQDAKPFEWALDYDKKQKEDLIQRDHDSLIRYEKWELSKRAFQTNDHYLPMLYIIGMQGETENIEFIHEGIQHGSISHRSFLIG